MTGAHHPLDRRTRLQVAGDRHRLGRIVPTDGVRQRVDQGVDRRRVFFVVVLDDPLPAPLVEDLSGEVVLDQLADLDPPQVGGAHRDAVGSAGDAQVVGDEALFVVVPHETDVEVVGVFVGDDDAHRARDVAGQPVRADRDLAACCDVELHRYSIVNARCTQSIGAACRLAPCSSAAVSRCRLHRVVYIIGRR